MPENCHLKYPEKKKRFDYRSRERKIENINIVRNLANGQASKQWNEDRMPQCPTSERLKNIG